MASQGSTSRLAQMQMRFQKKQQQEREQRKMEMTGSKSTADSNDITTKNLNSTIGPGKVRQMFDERRRGAGIDKSYPLRPIASKSSGSTTSTTTSTTRQTTMRKQQTSTVRQMNGRVTNESLQKISRNGNEAFSNTLNGNVALTAKQQHFGDDEIDNEAFPDYQEASATDTLGATLISKLPNVGKLASLSIDDNSKRTTNGLANGDRNNNNNGSTAGARAKSNSNIKLKPVVTKKTIPAEPINRTRVAEKSRTPSNSKPISAPERTEKPVKSNAKSIPSSPTKMAATVAPIVKPAIRESTPPPGMVSCKICHRHFNTDRVEKHQEVCQRTAVKKRKIFDASKHRVKGTEAEQYVRKSQRSAGPKAAAIPAKQTAAEQAAAAKKGNWRKKHEEFIAAIRAAKEMQAHLARGGKLSDLPPPPPSENPDYIQCPHCMRRFNEAAATRHIPKCATMIHNKPKPGAPAKKR